MLFKLEKKVGNFLKAIEFSDSKSNILLAVSGGADSIALLYVLHALTSQNILSLNLYCAHINHQLRDDANSDEEFVVEQAQKLNIPVITKRLDINTFARDNKLSIETAARQLRIKCLTEIAQANQCKWIATGHQKNDNAETIIHRMLRGTGFRGLAGIWPVREFEKNIYFVRPLLCVTREEIIRYLEQKKLKWHEDYTNAKFIYTRNHIRHRLIPSLQKQCKSSLIEQLSELSENAYKLYKQIRLTVDVLWPQVSICNDEKVVLKRHILKTQTKPIQLELIRRALSYLGSGERDITSEHYERIFEQAEKGSTRNTIQLPNKFFVHVEYGNLIFSSNRALISQSYISHSDQSQSVNLTIPGKTVFNNITIEASFVEQKERDFKKFLKTKTSSIEWFDFDKIKQPLIVRLRKEGDRFVPFGQKEKKKIGKFLTAQHIPEKIRNKTLIIEDAEKIIWLCPVRTSEQTKITSKTINILQLQIRNIKSD